MNTKRDWLFCGHVALDKCNVSRWEQVKNILIVENFICQRSKSYTFTVWLNYSRCSGEVVRSFEAEANTNEVCLHPEDNNVFIVAESSFGAVTQFDLRTPAGMMSSDSKQIKGL